MVANAYLEIEAVNQRAKAILRQLSSDGLFKDARLWTEQDWADLWECLKTATAHISERHKAQVREEHRERLC